MTDLDLRLVRYFTSVASHLHYGRAAAELRIAQPSLSRQISRLEALVGARLLDRTRQGTRLTEAGAAFLPRAHQLLRSAEEATAVARAASRPGRITVGYTAGLIVTPAVRQLRHRHPEAEVQTLHLDWNGARAALLDRRADAVVTRRPLVPSGLVVTKLYDEPRVLLVPVGHRLAGRDSVTLDDLEGEPMPRFRDAAYDAYWRVDPRPGGHAAPDGPLVESLEDKIEHIAAGQAVSIVPAALYATGVRAGLTTVPLRGVEPSDVVVAVREDDFSPLVAAFREVAAERLSPVRGA
ncbi:LysR substrate-binding domain-containing protein [Amycolatopsis sp. PS_44_ISF1]|uniref:LysR family transcriptional regulator n=1 Tax=Amycolatopsis sp. PS_44_ISF1 TaxID=2974917 RepID=UPI0028DDD885|nr:LysR substrate-binding domain-containing protein [Amycolatopsis sp. PS_44_ISF1]MDT8912780.1 LysR substrate-binding domain-containing protein [Amycolatopsis sp. PS_44_ISF1]